MKFKTLLAAAFGLLAISGSAMAVDCPSQGLVKSSAIVQAFQDVQMPGLWLSAGQADAINGNWTVAVGEYKAANMMDAITKGQALLSSLRLAPGFKQTASDGTVYCVYYANREKGLAVLAIQDNGFKRVKPLMKSFR